MPRKSKIPPRRFNLKSDGSSYLVLAWDDGFFDVVYYRPYTVGEDGVEDEKTANSIHKRFAIRKRKLIDGLRVVFAEDLKAEWDADMVEYMVRQDPRIPKFPGMIEKPEWDEADGPEEEPKKWVPIPITYTDDGRVIIATESEQQLDLQAPTTDPT